jgi:hypothetical protein
VFIALLFSTKQQTINETLISCFHVWDLNMIFLLLKEDKDEGAEEKELLSGLDK